MLKIIVAPARNATNFRIFYRNPWLSVWRIFTIVIVARFFFRIMHLLFLVVYVVSSTKTFNL